MLAANFYLHTPQHYCDFCFQPNYEFVMCQGPCQKLYCKSCFKRFGVARHCLFCGLTLKGAFIPAKQATFHCPSPSCKATLSSQLQFSHHSQDCATIPQPLREQFYFRNKYQCSRGHDLVFKPIQASCFNCQQESDTSQCPECQTKYCFECRPPPCSNDRCPRGHVLMIRKGQDTMTCNFCGITMYSMANKKVFSDRQCNFDICEYCHSRLPQASHCSDSGRKSNIGSEPS